MENMNKDLLERFFKDECTAEESAKVLKWFDTEDGKKFLQGELDSDIENMMSGSGQFGSGYPDPDSEKILKSIQGMIRKQEFRNKRKRQVIYPIFKAAAAILVVLAASFFYQNVYLPESEEITEHVPIHYTTSEDQQRKITLGDGSTIQLNSNSEIWVSGTYMSERREIQLQGEAFFDVIHDPERPFKVYANESEVEVLGTAFNVKSNVHGDNIQVAVTEGRVAFRSNDTFAEIQSVILHEGQYGYLDLTNNDLIVDEIAIENYLAWMSGELVFEDLSLEKVCLQLNRLYEVQCGFENDQLSGLRLTANFSDDSLKKTLSVIALTLEIEFSVVNGQVEWMNKYQSEAGSGEW
jgi:transmembrane sensor